jgi:quinol monooxygenase YgiN
MIDTNRRLKPPEDQKVYLLVELTILPGFLEEVKAILKEALVPTLQEPGCVGLVETARNDDPHKLVLFEVFSSATAHECHPRAGLYKASDRIAARQDVWSINTD